MSEYDDLAWILAQEPTGVPGIQNMSGSSTASGLFQTTAANRQAFYPRGETSVGSAIEEARGGIRYIEQNYGSAAAARRFWEEHHWY